MCREAKPHRNDVATVTAKAANAKAKAARVSSAYHPVLRPQTSGALKIP